MLPINAQAFSFEVMNTRHLHDYHAFEDVTLPEGKVIIPGMPATAPTGSSTPS